MNILLIGYGKMGKEIEAAATARGHAVVAKCTTQNVLTADMLGAADVVVDFSSADGIVDRSAMVLKSGKALVIGTTGWNDRRDAVRKMTIEAGGALVHGSNFSIGVQLLLALASKAATLFDPFPDYDVSVHETHHNQKADSPSGTALSIADKLLTGLHRKSHVLKNTTEGRIAPNALHVTSTRVGSVPGAHVITFDSPADTLELRHTARNRSGFASGAVFAAAWILQRKGFYDFSEVFVTHD